MSTSLLLSSEPTNSHSIKIEIDQVKLSDWANILLQFDDANLYQTIEYGRNVPGGKNLSHLVVKKNDEPIAVAQSRILKLPIINRGIAYVYWGPLWRKKNETPDKKILCVALKALYDEYVIKRNYLLRIVPNIIEHKDFAYRALFESIGFFLNESAKRELTILLDLTKSLEELRNNLRGNWRNHLNKAERNGLEIKTGCADEQYEIFQKIYMEMFTRKQFSDSPDIRNFVKIQNELSPELKMQVFICYSGNEPLAGAVCSAIGNTGIYLLGAITDNGKKSQGSYLIQFKILEFLKKCGCKCYDLGGIDPQKNPGVFHFKDGMGGEKSSYIGQFEAWHSWISWAIVKSGSLYKKIIEAKNLLYLNAWKINSAA